MDLNTDQLRSGLGQLLRAYAGAGLKRFNRSSHAPLSAQSLAQLSAWAAVNSSEDNTPEPSSGYVAAVQPRQSPGTASGGAPVGISQSPRDVAAVKNSAPAIPRGPAAPAIVPPTEPFVGRWQLPAASLEERARKLLELDAQVKACRKCEELVCYRRQTVFGEGNLQPRVCFYGEAPGADEDAQGRPFVGAAGKLLSDIIRAMKLTREEVYILNSLKCRPPQNRTPLPEEVDNCRPYALAQLELLQPEFIILLGAVAVRSVLQSSDPVGRLRGRFHHFHGARVLVTYHPAYLLRNAEAKKLVWADVQLVMRELGTIGKN